VTYLKAPSVQLATTLLDGAPLREGGKPMSVSEWVAGGAGLPEPLC
jgi:hypothetical protein